MNDKITANYPAEYSPWGKFMLDSRKLDMAHGKLRVWHWFWGFYYLDNVLPNFNFETIRNALHETHWLKGQPDFNELEYLKIRVDALINEINKTEDKSKINFSGMLFNQTFDFSYFLFPMAVSFAQAQFTDDIDFSRANFQRGVNFTNTVFDKKVCFEHAVFHHDANFENAELYNDADFGTTTFSNNANFRNTSFLKNTYFTGATFSETADFEKATFSGKTAKFRNTTFTKIVNFKETTFNGYANFKASTFDGRTIFQKAKFELHTPRFYGATFNNEMILNGITLPKTARSKEEGESDNDDDYQKRIEENQSAYETLIHLMEKQNKYHEKHRFFREEMRWRQVENTLKQRQLKNSLVKNEPRLFWWRIKIRWQRLENALTIAFYWLYENLADYGYGIGRAFTWWLGNICFWTGILFFFGYDNIHFTYERLARSFLTSLSNAHSFFLSKSERVSGCCNINESTLIFDMIWAVETILGAAFLFLLLTTLRVRFRLK